MRWQFDLVKYTTIATASANSILPVEIITFKRYAYLVTTVYILGKWIIFCIYQILILKKRSKAQYLLVAGVAKVISETNSLTFMMIFRFLKRDNWIFTTVKHNFHKSNNTCSSAWIHFKTKHVGLYCSINYFEIILTSTVSLTERISSLCSQEKPSRARTSISTITTG